MPASSDYATPVGGGLKLKGAKNAGIDKTKSKKKKKKIKAPSAAAQQQDEQGGGGRESPAEARDRAEKDDEDAEDGRRAALVEGGSGGKTEAERRHEEMRWKRLNERVKREGHKTHKERVEELNRYLSGLSEHHDMPRIGPG